MTKEKKRGEKKVSAKRAQRSKVNARNLEIVCIYSCHCVILGILLI